jgi:Ca2+-binding RTX toxin-like protein
VIGGAGNDTLFGGTGDDILSGNSGADTFAFFNGNGNDTVLDFNLNDDILDLSGTETDFTDLASVEAAASNAVQNGTSGLLINIGDGESIFITGLSTDNLDSINIIF